MKIQDILQKQGELYKNLTTDKAIQTYNKKIEKPKLVSYKEFVILEQEHKAITELEKLFGKEFVIVSGPSKLYDFEISIQNNQVTYLRCTKLFHCLTYIPEQINNLTNLEILELYANKIQKIENLDNLQKLEELWLFSNQITEIKNLDNLFNLQRLELSHNQIAEIKNLDNLANLQKLDLCWNKIGKVKGLDDLISLKFLALGENPIRNMEKVWELRDNGVEVTI